MAEIRALETVARPMQRLGYLKRIVKRVTTLSTASLDNVGNDLISTVTRKTRVALNEPRAAYIKQRLYDRVYKTLKEQTEAWLHERHDGSEPVFVSLEIQDLYLSDPALPSQVGKLVKTDWRAYPPLGISLGFVRAGTYSANTRALSLVHFTPDTELQAFLEFKPEANPLLVSRSQSLLFLYTFLDNDGEVVAPLFGQLLNEHPTVFSDRDAGDKLPDIYRSITARHRKGVVSADTRERLAALDKSADSIARSKNSQRYVGSAREHASRPRVEPYVDLGLLSKPDPAKYEQYCFSNAGRVWAEALNAAPTSKELGLFLTERFFSVAARALNIDPQPGGEQAQAVRYLFDAWRGLQSPGGYAPIEELALVAGIDALLRDGVVIEIANARQALIDYQKERPYDVRFTVDRLGVLAHARFLETPPDTRKNADVTGQ